MCCVSPLETLKSYLSKGPSIWSLMTEIIYFATFTATLTTIFTSIVQHLSQITLFCSATTASRGTNTQRETLHPHVCNKVFLSRYVYADIYDGWNGRMEVCVRRISAGLYRSYTKALRFLCQASCIIRRSSGCSSKNKTDKCMLESYISVYMQEVSFECSSDQRPASSWLSGPNTTSISFRWPVYRWKNAWYVCRYWSSFRTRWRLSMKHTYILRFSSLFIWVDNRRNSNCSRCLLSCCLCFPWSHTPWLWLSLDLILLLHLCIRDIWLCHYS